MSIIEKAVNRLESGVSKRLEKVARPRDPNATRPGAAEAGRNIRQTGHSEATQKVMAEYADPAVYGQIRDQGFMAPKDKLQQTMDEYRAIKRPLLNNIFGKREAMIDNARLILISSAMAGEGKTYTSINLALSMAREQGLSVLLVDADVERRNASRVFGAEDAPGLLDYLNDEEGDIGPFLIDVEVANLTLLPAGQRNTFSTELLSSDHMQALVNEWLDESPGLVVIIDAPPMLQTAEPQVLAGYAGQIVMVVEAVKTPKNAVTQALATLDKNKAINLVFNRTHRTLGLSYYGSYYGNLT